MICPAKLFINIYIPSNFCSIKSLMLLPSMYMFEARICFVLCCVPTIIHVVLS